MPGNQFCRLHFGFSTEYTASQLLAEQRTSAGYCFDNRRAGSGCRSGSPPGSHSPPVDASAACFSFGFRFLPASAACLFPFNLSQRPAGSFAQLQRPDHTAQLPECRVRIANARTKQPYVLWCTNPLHAAPGMAAECIVHRSIRIRYAAARRPTRSGPRYCSPCRHEIFKLNPHDHAAPCGCPGPVPAGHGSGSLCCLLHSW